MLSVDEELWHKTMPEHIQKLVQSNNDNEDEDDDSEDEDDESEYEDDDSESEDDDNEDEDDDDEDEDEDGDNKAQPKPQSTRKWNKKSTD